MLDRPPLPGESVDRYIERVRKALPGLDGAALAELRRQANDAQARKLAWR
jgi:hypothetical protein